jgi:crossover junction endodeoxyribonuclease RuvC
VLGIDPGLTRCGLAVLAGGPSPSLVYASAIRTDSGAPLAERLLAIDEGLREAIEAHRPTVVATEQVLFNANARTAMATAQAAGVAMAAAARCGLAVHRYSPTAVKLAVAGHGGASKDAVSRMVAAQLGLSTPPRPADAADAAAVALCHLASLGTPAAAGPATWDDLVEARGLPVKGGTGTGS